ncbi:hypothetical protein Tco_1524288 [Tanacetum coccineum]
MALPLRYERHEWLRLAEIEDLDMIERLKMQHRGVDGEVLFTTSIWREFLRIRRSLVREDALMLQEDVQADLTPHQAPQMHQATALAPRTIGKRL